MALTSLCSAASSMVVPGPSGRVRPLVSSTCSGVSFALGRRNHALSGVRQSFPRRSVCLEQSFRRLSIRAEMEAGEVDADTEGPVPPDLPSPALRKKSRDSVKAGRKQNVVLRFLWLEKNIGISLDQVVPGHGIIPLSPYFFWPRKDAWEELKAKLDSMRWISRRTTIILLNQATDIINLWQQNATNLPELSLSSERLEEAPPLHLDKVCTKVEAASEEQIVKTLDALAAVSSHSEAHIVDGILADETIRTYEAIQTQQSN